MINNSIKRIWAIAKKDFRSFLFSPVFYGSAVFFVLFLSIGLFYVQKFFMLNAASLRPFFFLFPLAYILTIPAITAKNWAEEKKSGTVEILLTLPFTETELCIGKFLSSFFTLLLFIALSLPVPLSLSPLGSFDTGLIFSEYIGVILLGSAAISISLFISSLLKTQATAFLSSSALLLALMVPGVLGYGSSIPLWLNNFFKLFSLSDHLQSFTRGLLDSRDISYFILVIIIFLFLNTRVLIGRKSL